MSLVFGVYVSLVGVAVVFVTLLAVAATSKGMQRLLGIKTEAPQSDLQKRARVAAMAAVHCYLGLREHRHPRLRVGAGLSRWSAVARVESLRIGEGISDEA